MASSSTVQHRTEQIEQAFPGGVTIIPDAGGCASMLPGMTTTGDRLQVSAEWLATASDEEFTFVLEHEKGHHQARVQLAEDRDWGQPAGMSAGEWFDSPQWAGIATESALNAHIVR